MALTATANDKVVKDTMTILGMDQSAFVWISKSDRDNLGLHFVMKDKNTNDKIYQIVKPMGAVSILIFCTKTKECEDLCGTYHSVASIFIAVLCDLMNVFCTCTKTH